MHNNKGSPAQNRLIGSRLTTSKEAIKALFNSIPIPSFVWQKVDQDFILVDYNDAAMEITRGKIDRLLGAKIEELSPDLPEVKEELLKCFTQQSSLFIEREYRFRTTGETKFLSSKYVFIPPDLVLVHSEDITPRKEAENKLKASETRYRELADLLPQTIYETDDAYNLTYSNQAGFESFGYTQEDVQAGLSVFELIIPEERDKVIQNIIKVMKGESSGGNEYTALRKDGTTFPASIYSLPIIRDGKVIGLRGLVADISKLKEAQIELQQANEKLERRVKERTAKLAEANQSLQTEIAERELIEQILKQSEEKYSSVVKQSAESIFLIDLESRYLIEANLSFQKLLGYGKDEISGLQMYDFIAHNRDNIDQNVNIIIKKGQHFIGDRKYKKKNGTLVDVEVTASLITNNETKLLCVVARDITARKQAEEELEKYHLHLEDLVAERTQAFSLTNQKLQEELVERKRTELALQLSKQRFELLYEENPSMYFTIDLKGKILSVNKFGADQLGFSVEELLGKSVYTIIYKEDRKIVQRQLQDMYASNKKIDNWEFRKVCNDGKIIWVKESARLIRDDAGKSLILIVCDDITDKRKAQNEREKLLKQLAEREKLAILGQFTAAVTHEINNPLDIIVTKTDALANQYHHLPEVLIYTEKIKEQVFRINRLAGDILSYAKPHHSEFAPVDINKILIHIIELLQGCYHDAIKIETKLKPNLPLIPADAIGLEIVFKNIILNAIQSFENSGTIIISTQLLKGEHLRIAIKDNGKGIEQSRLNKIFEQFYTSKQDTGGTGLGLVISLEIVKKHHGTINVRSKLGSGTTFNINLPVCSVA